jgi:Zn-dependent alcohol dehydrogenase
MVAFGVNDLKECEIVVAPPRAGEVRVKVICNALCHTDVYTLSGADPEGLFPSILGHEATAIVESVGPGVTSVVVGDTVVPGYTPQCKGSDCIFCISPKTNLCPKIRGTQGKGQMPDGTSRFTLKSDGSTLWHFMGCSTFAEYTVLAEISCAKVDPVLDPKKSCLFGCGIATGLGAVRLHAVTTVSGACGRARATSASAHGRAPPHAQSPRRCVPCAEHPRACAPALPVAAARRRVQVWNTAKVEPFSSVAVFGLGAVGMAVVQGAKAIGATTIVGIDVNPKKFELAKSLGCTACLNPKDFDKPMQQVLVGESPTGFGFDYTFDCTGNTDVRRHAPSALRSAVRSARRPPDHARVAVGGSGDALGPRGSAPRVGLVHAHWRCCIGQGDLDSPLPVHHWPQVHRHRMCARRRRGARPRTSTHDRKCRASARPQVHDRECTAASARVRAAARAWHHAFPACGSCAARVRLACGR